MTETARSFSESHHAGNVLKGEVAKGLPTKPEEIDLRFLRALRFSDAYDGMSDVVDGVECTVILYGNRIAYQKFADLVMGSTEQRSEEGNKLYYRMYHVSQLYLKIQAIGRVLFFREQLKEGVDTFYMSEEDRVILMSHPQGIEMAEDYGLVLKPAKKDSHFTVTVSKFYDPEVYRG